MNYSNNNDNNDNNDIDKEWELYLKNENKQDNTNLQNNKNNNVKNNTKNLKSEKQNNQKLKYDKSSLSNLNDYNNNLANLEKDYNNNIENLEKLPNSENLTNIESLKKDYNNNLTNLEKNYNNKLTNLDNDYNVLRNSLDKDNENELNKINNENYENYNKNENYENQKFESINSKLNENLIIPKIGEIYISTKTHIVYLNMPIDLKIIFWKIPIISYNTPNEGIIKKQMKFNSNTEETLNYIKEMLKNEKYYDEYIITSINNPEGRIKFKDIRKISVGLCKKDILNLNRKKKSAFYNCLVLIIRFKMENTFKEFHIKIFNTGKIELPGIQNNDMFFIILDKIIEILQPHIDEKLSYKNDNTNNEPILINSNFNCGFNIDREVFFNLLKNKYNMQTFYDPCSYPGIQCRIYYNKLTNTFSAKKHIIAIDESEIIENNNQKINNKTKNKLVKEISFMIFRTGNILIVGKCDEKILNIAYEYIKCILNTEFRIICKSINVISPPIIKKKNKRPKYIKINDSNI